MKKLILSICAALIIIAVGCKSGPSSSDPKATLLAFFEAMSKKDIQGAKKYATKESESMFSMMEMGMKMAEKNKDAAEDDEFKNFDKANMEFGEAKIDGDKATVPVTNKKENETTNFILKKEGGAWKVAFDKASLAEMAGEKMKEKGMDDAATELNNMNSDTLQNAIKEGMNAVDSLKDAMKKLEEK